MPSKTQIENEIESYLNQNLLACIDDFKNLRREGYEINYNTLSSDIQVGLKDITILLNFPINLKLSDFEFDFNRFKIILENSLGKLYQDASNIFKEENEKFFLEDLTLDLMAIYDEIPTSGVNFDCIPKTWLKSDIAEKFKQVLSINIPETKIQGSKYNVKDGEENFVIKGPKVNKDISINFLYSPEWPFLIDILGEDEVLTQDPFTKGEISKFLAPIFCLNSHNFVYDIKFPTLVTLADEKGFFQFATQVIIDNNQPRENRLAINTYDTEPELCKYPLTDMKVFAMGYKNDNTLASLQNAKISIKCLSSVCDIGQTIQQGNAFFLDAKFPQCTNALITAEKENFHRGELLVSTNEPSTISIILEPIYELDLKIEIIDDNGNIRTIQPTEQAIFEFENEDKKFSTQVVYSGTDKIKLIAGNYKVKSYLTVSSSQGFKIEDQKIKICSDTPRRSFLGALGLTERKCETQTIPGTSLDSILSGGASFTWSIERQALASSSKITLYTVRGKTPSTMQELTKTDEMISQNSKIAKKPLLS